MALTDADYLRLLLNEEIPAGGADTDTLFTNEQVAELLLRNHSHLYAAASSGWIVKAADLARLIDIDESGSKRKLSQLWEHARKMAEFYGSMVPKSIAEGVFTSARIIGKSFSLREYPEWMVDPGEDVQWVETK